jgi:O-methyltransferase
MNILHPVGAKKIYILKKIEKIFGQIILFFLSIFLKIDRNYNELIISRAFYAPWKEDKSFCSIYEKVKDLTLLDTKRLYTLWYLVNDLKNINASILDVGCLQGGAGFLMSKANNKGTTYLFDTFEGFLEEEKFHKKRHFVYKEIKIVKDNAKEFNLRNINIYKCSFPDGLGQSFKKKKIKLCHLDVNTYKSTKKSFDFVMKRIIKGGIIVFDDYGMHTVDSIKKFVGEIAKKHKRDFYFIYNYMGQCILIKK